MTIETILMAFFAAIIVTLVNALVRQTVRAEQAANELAALKAKYEGEQPDPKLVALLHRCRELSRPKAS